MGSNSYHTHRGTDRRERGHLILRWRGRGSRLAVLLAALVLSGLTFATAGCSDGSLAEAREAERAGDLQTAVELYRERLAAAPDDLEAVKGLAVDLYLLRDLDGALPFQERAVASDPKEVQIRVELGFNYLNHQGRPAEAVAVLAEAAALERSAKVLTFLAQAQIAAGRTTDAEASLRAAIAEDESYGHAYTVLIGLLEAQGRPAEAEELRAAATESGAATGTGG